MQVIITGKNVELTDALKSYVEKKVKRLEKYLEEPITIQVVLSSEKFRRIADITISAKEGVFHGSEESHDMYTSIDKVVDTMEITLRRRKEKVKENKYKGVRPGSEEEFVSQPETVAREPEIIEEKVDTKPMSVEEAALQLEALGLNFLAFINARTGRMNVIYRRKDGNLGLIVPE
ncbi:sigma-54 modulation protein [Thermosulfidibacter takaii ABI70S6]|uniref:Ribosome hibernation promoting factor n=1 Tax=Thermosulfidibacter takaii (strain DSM 17441 / JCM 13301 / NBRC 103674 / ABI70S6) TaxID=1298851 RepID=A0A0S3QSF9_THET7|nr:ribosome-associated translation inhibitor RaiA [Thermosulfidibacter takaii]BAT71252.1 sigma-54 modulation protein [Thermosulfidibacter takaii ABI70S6]